jgi:two-component system sensor histidine kinase UhpB
MHQQQRSDAIAPAGRFPADISIAASARPAADIVEAQDNERTRIARDLHDSVGQKIAVLQVSLAQIAQALPLEARASVLEVERQISEIAGELHAISHELYPSRLQLIGVAAAIAALCRDTSQQSGIDISFAGDAALTGIGPRESLGLYRIVQEAVQNIVKHSHARHATVRLVRRCGVLALTVMDFGCGFDDSQPSKGLGLMSMRQRAQSLDGTMSVQTRKSGGTRIRVQIPLAHSDY